MSVHNFCKKFLLRKLFKGGNYLRKYGIYPLFSQQVILVQIKPHYGLATIWNFGLKNQMPKKDCDLSKLPH